DRRLTGLALRALRIARRGSLQRAAVGGRGLIAETPERAELSVGDAARVGHVAIHVVDDLPGRDCVQASRMERGDSGLREAGERIPEHANMPGRPGLASGPLDRRRPVRVLHGIAEVELPL